MDCLQVPAPAVAPRTPQETKEVEALYEGVRRILNIDCWDGRRAGDCKYGVYLFFDYDGEPIYVGQTQERLRTRIRRHLTNQRTDAVAMSVLDPLEVAEIEMWPFWGLRDEVKETLNRAEFTVYTKALRESAFNVILNKNDIPTTELVPLPPLVSEPILQGDSRRHREHPDIRLVRRARTIANLARVISERKVLIGIRRTLWAQARQLERLAQTRLEALDGQES